MQLLETEKSLVREIMQFWFDTPKTVPEKIQLWFGGTAEIDESIRVRFEFYVQAAYEGKYEHWKNSVDSCLALILLLDQFSLNIYRHQRRSFEMVEKALPISKFALNQGFHENLDLFRKVFLYLPFEHSEHISDQIESVRLFEELHANSSSELKGVSQKMLEFAVDHMKVIQEFGRYPGRNALFDRESSVAEKEYLAGPGPHY